MGAKVGHVVTEATRKKLSDANKGKRVGYKHSIESRKKMSEASKGRHPTPETLQKLRDSHKDQRPTKETIEKQRSAKKGKTPKNLQMLHQLNKGRPKSEIAKKNMSTGQKKRYAHVIKKVLLILTPEERHLRLSRAHKDHPSKYWLNKRMREDMKTKMCEAKIGGFWYGAVRYYDYPVYCERFDDSLRERTRAFRGYVCFECGTPQNGEKLHIHHVHYNKKMCCDGSPRDLVPLCHDCHNKTNYNREFWEIHFTEMIYALDPVRGKCFLTKEEMVALKPQNPFL